jgi:hypothetical protein
VSASNKIGDRLIAAAQVAGVLATGWFVWVNAVLPQLGLKSVAGMVAQALLYVALAWVCGAVVTFWVYFVVSLADLPRATRFSFAHLGAGDVVCACHRAAVHSLVRRICREPLLGRERHAATDLPVGRH